MLACYRSAIWIYYLRATPAASRLAPRKSENRHPNKRYSPDYVQMGESLYGTVDIDRVFAEHQAGATIILEGVHRTWGPLSQFCRELEGTLGHPLQANLYLTPKAAQGFEAHYDTHYVLIVQITGHKKWRIFPPHFGYHCDLSPTRAIRAPLLDLCRCTNWHKETCSISPEVIRMRR